MDGGNEPYGCLLSAAAVGRKASQIMGSVWTVGLAEGMHDEWSGMEPGEHVQGVTEGYGTTLQG